MQRTYAWGRGVEPGPHNHTFARYGETQMTIIVLLYTGGGMPETEEEMAAVKKAWGDWYGQLGEAIVDGGSRSRRWPGPGQCPGNDVLAHTGNPLALWDKIW
jgi:hypothetical protein